jgi:cell division protein ZipA
MENIRWILLLAGFVIVLGIYLYGRYHAEREEAQDQAERKSTRPGRDIDPLFDQPGDSEAVEAELERLEQLISEDKPQSGDVTDDAPATAPKAPPAEPDKVVTLFVMAPTGVPFPGSFVFEAMETAGLQYGDMEIFHCPDSRTGGSVPLFSVANMVEPGTFDLSAIATFTTSGLVLFLQLPGPADPVQAFDKMVEAARSLADSLGGTVCDATRSVLTNQTIGHMREDVIDYQLRQRVAKTAS